MRDFSPLAPEARKRAHWQRRLDRLRPGARTYEVAKRVVVGVYNDGFIHAGNLAYMALLTLFPSFIVAAAVAHFFGRTEDGMTAVVAFLQTVQPDVARSEEHTSELQSLMRTPTAVFCLKKNNTKTHTSQL